MSSFPTFRDIQTAAKRIKPYVHRTPVLTCESINEIVGAHLFFKCENFQKVGAFKFRGACNAVFSLSSADAIKGIATHSSGNHAAAVALSARLRNIEAHVVMPKNTSEVKKRAVESYGAHIAYCEPTLVAREQALAQIVEDTAAMEIHSYNDSFVIAGQGTVALEFLEEIPDLDIILAPIGGGGLISGTALASSAINQKIQVIGVEPAGADDAYRSFRSGTLVPSLNPKTIADGLLTSLGDMTFSIIQQHVNDIVTVSEEEIVHAMRMVWERMKIIIEPSSAVPVAAILKGAVSLTGKKMGVILTGGNVDLEQLPW